MRSMEGGGAVGTDGLAGDVGGGLAAKPRDERSDVFWSAEPSSGNGSQIGVAHFGFAGPAEADLAGPFGEDHVGLGGPRAHGVDGDAGAGQLDRGSLGESD